MLANVKFSLSLHINKIKKYVNKISSQKLLILQSRANILDGTRSRSIDEGA